MLKEQPKSAAVGTYTRVASVAGCEFEVTAPVVYRRGAPCYEWTTAQRIELLMCVEFARRGILNGEAFRFMRKVVGLRATDLAELLDTTPETISHWETGKTSLPRAAWAVVASAVEDRFEEPPSTRTLDLLRAASKPARTTRMKLVV